VTRCARLAAHFSARPGQWIDGRELGQIAGAYAWRSRVSDLRHPPYNLTIENRQRKEQTLLGEPYTISEYRWVPDFQPTVKTTVMASLVPEHRHKSQNSCCCASLGDEAPCGWCDGPRREGMAPDAA
jgi:hypothetical protein